MRIGIIGAGTIGGTLTRRFAALGHDVAVASSRGLETLRDPASETGTVVLGRVEELGFDAVDAGGLDESWRQQPGTPAYPSDHDADGVRRALAEASPERPGEVRSPPDTPGTFAEPS